MRGVDVEKAAAIGAGEFDGTLRSDGSNDNGLVASLQRLGDEARVERLHRALADHHQRHHDTDRQQHARGEANEVSVEIAEIGAAIGDGESANPRHGDDEAGRCRREHRKGNAAHLAEIRQRRLAGKALPIGVGDEADRRVECLEGFHAREVQLIERQIILERIDCKDDRRHDQIGRQHMEGVRLPSHRLTRHLAADEQIQRVIDRIEEGIKKRLLAHDDLRHVASGGNAEQKNRRQSQSDLQPSRDGHLLSPADECASRGLRIFAG